MLRVPERDPVSRGARIVTRRFASSAEADRHDLAFWLQIPEHERVLQVWRLSQELWRLRGELRDEPGLCRSIARIRRR
jgi:hypothetical protein